MVSPTDGRLWGWVGLHSVSRAALGHCHLAPNASGAFAHIPSCLGGPCWGPTLSYRKRAFCGCWSCDVQSHASRWPLPCLALAGFLSGHVATPRDDPLTSDEPAWRPCLPTRTSKPPVTFHPSRFGVGRTNVHHHVLLAVLLFPPACAGFLEDGFLSLPRVFVFGPLVEIQRP